MLLDLSRLLLGVLLLVHPLGMTTPADAQLEARYDMRFHFIAQAAVKDAISGLSTESLKLEVATLDMAYTHPTTALGPRWALVNRLTLRKENVEAEEDIPLTFFEAVKTSRQRELAFGSENFLRLGYDAVLSRRLSSSWTLKGMGGTVLSVDEVADATPGDVWFRGGAQLDHTTRSGWTMGLGLLYSQLTGHSAFLPVVNLQSPASSAGWRLQVLTPNASLWYRFRNTAVEWGVMAEIDGTEYRLLDRRAVLYDSQGEIIDPKTDVSLAYSVVTVGPAVRLVEAQSVSAFFQLGMTMRRHYRFRSLDQSQTLVLPPGATIGAGEKLDFELERSTFVQGNLQYRLGAN